MYTSAGKQIMTADKIAVETTAVHPSEVDKMSTREFWELSGKK